MSGNKGAVERLLPVVAEFYSREGNECGGLLHVVLDDRNVGRSHVQRSIDEALRKGDAAAVYLGGRLLKLSKTQRGKLVDRYHHGRAVPSTLGPAYLPASPPYTPRALHFRNTPFQSFVAGLIGHAADRARAALTEVFVNAAVGSDEAGDGTAEKPFRTITRALQSRSGA